MRDQGRSGGVEGEAERESRRRADAGVVPFEREPGERAGGEERPEGAARPAHPSGEPDCQQRPAGRQLGRHACGRQEPAAADLVVGVELD